jgi:hypothetical protein
VLPLIDVGRLTFRFTGVAGALGAVGAGLDWTVGVGALFEIFAAT